MADKLVRVIKDVESSKISSLQLFKMENGLYLIYISNGNHSAGIHVTRTDLITLGAEAIKNVW